MYVIRFIKSNFHPSDNWSDWSQVKIVVTAENAKDLKLTCCIFVCIILLAQQYNAQRICAIATNDVKQPNLRNAANIDNGLANVTRPKIFNLKSACKIQLKSCG